MHACVYLSACMHVISSIRVEEAVEKLIRLQRLEDCQKKESTLRGKQFVFAFCHARLGRQKPHEILEILANTHEHTHVTSECPTLWSIWHFRGGHLEREQARGFLFRL